MIIKTIHLLLIIGLYVFLPHDTNANDSRLTINGDEILLDGKVIKVIGLRCSNALLSDNSTNDLIEALDLYQSYGINTISVFIMGSRFGDIKGYLPNATLNPVYRARFEKILDATAQRNMVTIVGCLYWSTSKAKEDLSDWTQADANQAIRNTAQWLADKNYTHVILDPDNEGMAVKANDWSVEEMIQAAKDANPNLIVANNTHQNPPNEDLNMHFGKPESGKPWFDSEATPNQAPGGYWGSYSKATHQTNPDYYNYSRIGRYTTEMKEDQLKQTHDEITQYNGYVFASTWIQCGPWEGVNGPFTHPGGYSNLGTASDEQAAWNTNIDKIHPDAGILWWLEFIRDNFIESEADTKPYNRFD